MKAILLLALLLGTVATYAQTYRCPQFYPGKTKAPAPLTGAMMRQSEPTPTNHLIEDEAAEEGFDAHYSLDPDDRTWLVCFYGGEKRIKGRFHDGHEWNQRMASADFDWETRLAPGISNCTIQTREIKASDARKSTWTVTVNCQ